MTHMKKIVSFIILALAIAACAKQTPAPVASGDVVDLRYRVKDVYDLPSSNAQAFTIVVKSTKPWTIKSTHPTWCMIETEEGEAVADSLVHVGKGENTTVKVQYYDNTKLDDRTDTIVIASQHWVGKRVIVNQKGIAYLDVDVAERALDMDKAGSDISFHIKSNQNWSVALADEQSKWLSIKEGATGSCDGTVVLSGPDNSGEMRYGRLDIMDRNGKKMKWQVVVAQDGVQLEPVAIAIYNEDTKKYDLETREDFIPHTCELPVKSNSSWTIAKKNASDSWFTILDNGGTGDASARIQFQQNDGTEIREAMVVLSTVPSQPGAAVVTKEVKLRQAYKTVPTRYYFNDPAVYDLFPDSKNTSNGYINPPQMVSNGMLIVSMCQVKRSKLPFSGSYTFRWIEIDDAARVRMWFYLSSGNTIKFNLKAGNTELSGFNGLHNTTYDTSVKEHEITVENTEAPDGYCHVAFKLDGVEFSSVTTSATSDSGCVWGTSVDTFYMAVDNGGSAVVEWYEYAAPFSWE